MNKIKKRPALFLDRDGTMIIDPGYISKSKNITLYYGVIEAILAFKKNGYQIVVLTNQSGINRGYLNENDLSNIHNRLDTKLKNAKPDAYYFCPHLPEENCKCRKPKTGNIERAMQELNIKKEGSLIVGDRFSDIKLGENFNMPAFLVLTGMGYKSAGEIDKNGETIHSFAHLKELADYFLLKA